MDCKPVERPRENVWRLETEARERKLAASGDRGGMESEAGWLLVPQRLKKMFLGE